MKTIKPFTFTEYDKISDTLMYLDDSYVLKFVVVLKRKSIDKNKQDKSFHREIMYLKDGVRHYNINRDYKFYFLLSNNKDKDNYLTNSIILRPSDIMTLTYLIDNQIMRWYVGDTRIYFLDENSERLYIRKAYKDAIFPISDSSFMIFSPSIIEINTNNAEKKFVEGIKIQINTNEIEITLSKFLELVFYITKTDMVNAAMNMLNYVKTQPYGENMFNMNSGSMVESNNIRRNFFNGT